MSDTWTTTADFDGGTKSNSSGNFEIETVTDNENNTANTIVLGNRRGDAFNFADADGLTWKWEEHANTTVAPAVRDIDTTVNDALYIKQTMGTAGASHLCTTDTMSGDFDIRVNLLAAFENGNQYVYHRFWISDNDQVYIVIRKSAAGAYTLISTTIIGGVAGSTTTASWTDYDLSFRITRVGDAVTTYYDLAGGDSWTQHRAVASGFSTDPGVYVVGVYHGVTNGSTYATYSSLRYDTATWTTATYRTSGNWKSNTITNSLLFGSIAITTTDCDANNYIDKIEILKSSDESVITTYSGNITSNTTTTLTSADFDNGFGGTNINYKIKVYLHGDGTKGAELSDITIEYGTTGPSFYATNKSTRITFGYINASKVARYGGS